MVVYGSIIGKHMGSELNGLKSRRLRDKGLGLQSRSRGASLLGSFGDLDFQTLVGRINRILLRPVTSVNIEV